MLIKGNEVEVNLGGEWLKFPPAFVLAHDATGKHFRRCDFYVLQAVPASCKDACKFSDEDIEAAQDYYEESELAPVGVVLPHGRKYEPIGDVGDFHYRRHGSNRDILGKAYRGRFHHAYDPEVPIRIRQTDSYRIVESLAPVAIAKAAARTRRPSIARAWRLVLPTGCVVTRHGFEWP